MSVDKFTKGTEHETRVDATGPLPEIFSRPHSARIAIYSEGPIPPEVYEVSAHKPGRFLEQLTEKVALLAKDQGSNVPVMAIKEVIDNLVHADFAGATISILEGGSVIRVSDQGAGISERKKAVERGYSTAENDHRTFIKGVGAGLFLAEQALVGVGGSLEIDSNLGGGSVFTLRAPGARGPMDASMLPGEKKSQEFPLSKRQKKVFFIIIELGEAGPSRIAKELSVGLSTIYRDLSALEEAGLIKTGARGKRALTEDGLRCVDLIVGS